MSYLQKVSLKRWQKFDKFWEFEFELLLFFTASVIEGDKINTLLFNYIK